MGWDGMVRVDGRTYTWMGRNDEFVDGEGNAAAPPAAQIAFEYTATRSIFSIAAGGVQLRVTFLTPVTADDLTRQSLTFSYLEVEVASLDGENHDIQLYCDVTGGELPFLSSEIVLIVNELGVTCTTEKYV